MVTIEDIKKKWAEAISARHAPDYVMIHPVNKESLENEVFSCIPNKNLMGELTMSFGMLIIWTNKIGPDDIICTRDAKR